MAEIIMRVIWKSDSMLSYMPDAMASFTKKPWSKYAYMLYIPKDVNKHLRRGVNDMTANPTTVAAI
jgi:hypothetical protein